MTSGNADAPTDEPAQIFNDKNGREHIKNSLSRLLCEYFRIQVRLGLTHAAEGDKLISRKAKHFSSWLHCCTDSCCGNLQDGVASGMARSVIHHLKVIKINEQQRQGISGWEARQPIE